MPFLVALLTMRPLGSWQMGRAMSSEKGLFRMGK